VVFGDGLVGLALQPASGINIAEYECDALSLAVKGAVIGALHPINTETNEFALRFEQNEGTQIPQSLFKGEEQTLKVSINGGSNLQATMQTEDSLLTEELTEIEV
jgi:hypothetical protein